MQKALDSVEWSKAYRLAQENDVEGLRKEVQSILAVLQDTQPTFTASKVLRLLSRWRPEPTADETKVRMGKTVWTVCFHEAAKQGHVDVLRYAVETLGDPDCLSMDGVPMIAAAARAGKVEATQYLLQQKADVGVEFNGFTSLTYALTCYYYFSTEGDEGQGEDALFAITQAFLKAGADVNWQSPSGDTAAHVITHRNGASVLRLLLSEGADPELRDNEGNTLFLVAADAAHSTCLQVLQEHGVNTKAKNKKNEDAVYLLLSFSRRQGMKDMDLMMGGTGGILPLQAVKKGGDTDLFVLLACGASANAHKDQLVRDTEIQHALTDYRSVLDFTEQYHTVLLDCLDTLVVDPRIGRVGGRGLYHQPLECVLEYSGLSMAADRVVNKSIDGNKIKRVMIPNSPRGAWYWRHQWLQGPQFGCHNQDCTNTEQKGDTMVQGSLFQMLMQATLDQAPMISQGGKIPQGGIRSMFNPNGPAVQHIMSSGQQGSFPEQPQNSAPVVFKKCARCQYAKYCSRACQKRHWKAGHQHECKKPVVRPKEFYSW